MKNNIHSLVILCLITLFSSCYVNRFTVGEGPIGKDKTATVYHKSKQVFLFWGLIAVGVNQPLTPDFRGYQIKSSFNIGDAIISAITGGLISTRTVKVMVKPDRAQGQSSTDGNMAD